MDYWWYFLEITQSKWDNVLVEKEEGAKDQLWLEWFIVREALQKVQANNKGEESQELERVTREDIEDTRRHVMDTKEEILARLAALEANLMRGGRE